ncbi:MAG: HAD-IIA family hydrolase [Acidaminococcaceae bacterium]
MPYNRGMKVVEGKLTVERLRKIKCFLFDMDGTINLGNTLIPGMDVFFQKLRASGKAFYLVTNNSSQGHEHYVKKMGGLGIPVQREEILISSDALTYYLQQLRPGARIFVLGTAALKELLRSAGFNLSEDGKGLVDFVIVGFDMDLAYAKLAIACRLIDKGVPYIATHPDVRCPIEGCEYIPDCGAMLALIKTATGTEPLNVMGKPYHYLVDLIRARTGYAKQEIAMVGDRLSTDIAFGLNNGLLSVLVLTGEATKADVDKGNIRPDLVLDHASEIANYL